MQHVCCSIFTLPVNYLLLNILLFTFFSSDVAIELPFTLMHPKPVEESIYTDGVYSTELF